MNVVILTVLLALSSFASAHVSLSFHLIPSPSLPQPQSLAPSTYARLINANTTLTAPLRRSSRFLFAKVPPGSYLAEITTHAYTFAPLRVDVSDQDHVEVWQTFRGNEWSNKGEKLGEATVAAGAGARATAQAGTGETTHADSSNADDLVELEVPVTALAQRQFYEKRQGFNPATLLKNPMIWLGGLAMLMMFGMPKLLENMDPEMREEFEKQQSSGPFAALSGGMTGGGANTGFDAAAWLAGTDNKITNQGQSKSSGSEGGSAKKRR